MEIVTETLQQYLDGGYVVGLDCYKCGRQPDVDLAGLCAFGHGNRRLPGLNLRCKKCGERLQKIVQPPKNDGGRPGYLVTPKE
jgi:hypothetical protein